MIKFNHLWYLLHICCDFAILVNPFFRAVDQPLRVGTYLPLPDNLAKKKAIINVQNRDNECLKWAIRAALFPPKDGNHAERPSKYPVKDDINYEGIDFPTPVKQIDKLEAQNKT